LRAAEVRVGAAEAFTSGAPHRGQWGLSSGAS